MKLGAVEAGGTTVRLAVGTLAPAGAAVEAKASLPTLDADSTLAAIRRWMSDHRPVAIGVASFGPLAVSEGRVLRTPKPGWTGADWRRALAPLGVPLGVDTDVNAAALAARTGAEPTSLPDAHPVWEVVAGHLGELAATILFVTAAGRVVFGGGVVTGRPFLLDGIERAVRRRLAGYLPWVGPRSPVVAAELAQPGLAGAFLLAQAAIR